MAKFKRDNCLLLSNLYLISPPTRITNMGKEAIINQVTINRDTISKDIINKIMGTGSNQIMDNRPMDKEDTDNRIMVNSRTMASMDSNNNMANSRIMVSTDNKDNMANSRTMVSTDNNNRSTANKEITVNTVNKVTIILMATSDQK